MNGVISLPATLWFSDIPEWVTVQTLKSESWDSLQEKDYVEMLRQSPSSSSAKVPILQFLGAKDRRVPYRQGLLFDAITQKSGTPIQTYLYENSGHDLDDSADTVMDIGIKSMMFLEEIEE